MLVLSRKQNQTIKIGPDVEITITKVVGGTAKIGIKAPRSLNIVRGELAPIEAPGVSQTPDTDSGAAA